MFSFPDSRNRGMFFLLSFYHNDKSNYSQPTFCDTSVGIAFTFVVTVSVLGK